MTFNEFLIEKINTVKEPKACPKCHYKEFHLLMKHDDLNQDIDIVCSRCIYEFGKLDFVIK